jgi:hypothetical protein
MNLPPVDLPYLYERYRELAARVQEAWETSGPANDEINTPAMLRQAMSQLIEMLDHIHDETGADAPKPAEINALCEYGLHLLEELSQLAADLDQPVLEAEILHLSLPCALWFARQGGEIRNLAPVVSTLAFFANQSSDPQVMANLFTQCCELVEASSPACEDSATHDPQNPWRLLLLNRAIIATRSHNPELMEPAFDAIVECLPQDAVRFFTEGMEQMAIIDYPSPVREIVGRYFATYASSRRLH